MSIELIRPRPEHASELGRICYEAFKDIADKHHFPHDFPTVGIARRLMSLLVQREDVYGVAAMNNGDVAGSNFLLTADEAAGVGPITVEVSLQGGRIGRALMEDVIDRARQERIEMVRLVQDAFNTTSMSLYGSLGFDVREPLALMQPPPAEEVDPSVRPVTEDDLSAVDELSRRFYKISRRNEVAAAIGSPFAYLLKEREGRIVGYYTQGMLGHGVAETEDDMVVMVRQAARALPPGHARCFCPLIDGNLFRRFLSAGFRTVKPMNLMTMGPYERPEGVWVPSVMF
ncbi:MAG TPA: GNAT family N-acetyltransferase [Dehalococcoidia bacterium]|nr:GNAT family N-acetyltransferase [Dehalococcoidia bacterium]